MNSLVARVDSLDRLIASRMATIGIVFLRLSLGLIFFWFGALKFFPGVSSAEELALRTITTLTFGVIPGKVSLILLALWETAIGLGLIFRVALRAVILLLLLQMAGTFLPLIFFPHETFTHFPFVPTLEGQYIIKNLVLIGAALVIGSTVRKL